MGFGNNIGTAYDSPLIYLRILLRTKTNMFLEYQKRKILKKSNRINNIIVEMCEIHIKK